MARRRWWFLLLAGLAIALLAGRVIAQVYTEYLWYAALGAAEVWAARYESLVALRAFCGASATLFVFANLYAVRQSVVSLVLPRRIGNLDIGEEVPKRRLTWTAAALSLLLGVGLAWTQTDWSGYLAARIGQPFGESDPYFADDLGFFVYRLPFELSLFHWTLTVVLIVIGLVVVLYALTPSLRWEQGMLYVSGYVRRHLAMLAGVLLLVLAWHYRLEMYTVLGDGSAGDGAFSYLDHHVVIPASLLLSLVALGAGLTVLWAGWTGQMRLAFAALTGVILAAVVARQVAPIVARRASPERDPGTRERPYEATRAGYTRRAFAVDRITTRDDALRFATLADAAPFVPVWDDEALRRASERALAGAAVGWATSDSGVVALVPSLAGGGSVAAYAASMTEDNGTPVRSVPGADAAPLLIVADSSARAVVIADSSGHVNAPSLSSAGAQLAHALSMQDFRVWFGTLPEPSPKLVAHRSVRERVHMVAPFFAQGSAIVPVWFADSLVWTVELYSSSQTYPLSQRIVIGGQERAYFQHAATALVNAATGRTVLVADSLPDPIASTWMTRFPRLFVRPTSLPPTIRRQLPPARDGARAQAIAYGRFGRRGETDVVRHLPDDDGADSALARSPAPLIAFPDAGTTGDLLPLLDSRETPRGVLVALGGSGHRSVWLPVDASAEPPAWTSALDSLRGADTISASLLVRGHVRVIPVRGELVLMQPRYDWRGSGAPRLLYVVVLSEDSVRSDRTLLALAGRRGAIPATPTDLPARIRDLYDEMRRASARGDWSAFGRAFDALGALLGRRRR